MTLFSMKFIQFPLSQVMIYVMSGIYPKKLKIIAERPPPHELGYLKTMLLLMATNKMNNWFNSIGNAIPKVFNRTNRNSAKSKGIYCTSSGKIVSCNENSTQ